MYGGVVILFTKELEFMVDKLFNDMIERGDLDTSNHMQMECLWFSFSKVIEDELIQVKNSWNSHYIRRSKYQTAAGIPNKLYFIPEELGAEDHKQPFDASDLLEAENEITSTSSAANVSSDYIDYFKYVLDTLGIPPPPTNWREGLIVYYQLLSVAT